MACVSVDSPKIKHFERRVFAGSGSRFTSGDTLFARITPCAENGKTALVGDFPAGDLFGFGSTELIVLAARPKISIPDFIYYMVKSPRVRELLISRMVGTSGRQRVPIEAFDDVRVLLPPLPEQRKIAAILSSVDEIIEKTEAVIEQLQVVKKAMLQELLTRGIPGRHSRFKQTEIGEIPEEWEVVALDSVAVRGSGHTPNKKEPTYWDGGIKWISLRDSARLDRLYISETTATVSAEGIRHSSAVEHPPGTVVLSRDAGVGKSAITTETMAVSQHFMAWRCGDRLDNHFLYYWLQCKKPEFERVAAGSTIKTIGLKYFKDLTIPLPLVVEQRQIGNALKSLDFRIFEEEQCLRKGIGVKSALMSVLLTGEVRVTHVEEAA